MLTGLVRLRKVEEVTTAKDEPTPVYVLDELVKAAQVSPEDAQHIVEHLLKKLDSKNPVVKAKSLRACKYLAQHGAYDAQRILQRTPAPIRNLQNYKGPPDMLKGDALNERVRVSAKEAIEAIFASGSTVQSSVKISSNASRIQGFGNQFSSPVNQYNGSGMTSYSSSQFNQEQQYSFQQQNSFLKETPKLEIYETRGQDVSKVSNVLGDEEDIVSTICQPSGVRLAPAKEDLRRFIDTVGTLNGPKVAILLQQKVEGKSWQESYRALCVIEAVILEGSSVSCGEIGVHFQGDLSIIRKCAESVQGSVRERANRILSIFTEEEDALGATNSKEAPSLLGDESTTSAPTIDLLGDISTPKQESSTPAISALDDLDTEVTVSKKETSEVDMFSGLSLADAKAPENESNKHLAALMAPSPPSDPFPDAPLTIEPSVVVSAPQVTNISIPSPTPYPVPNMIPQMQMGYGVPYPQPLMMNPRQMYFQPMPSQGSAMYTQGAPGIDNRGEVPLNAFMGPAHIEKRNSTGKTKSAFGFIGDHMTELRGKK